MAQLALPYDMYSLIRQRRGLGTPIQPKQTQALYQGYLTAENEKRLRERAINSEISYRNRAIDLQEKAMERQDDAATISGAVELGTLGYDIYDKYKTSQAAKQPAIDAGTKAIGEATPSSIPAGGGAQFIDALVPTAENQVAKLTAEQATRQALEIPGRTAGQAATDYAGKEAVQQVGEQAVTQTAGQVTGQVLGGVGSAYAAGSVARMLPIGSGETTEDALGAGGGAVAGAYYGSSFGPWGTVIGGIVGGAIGLFSDEK